MPILKPCLLTRGHVTYQFASFPEVLFVMLLVGPPLEPCSVSSIDDKLSIVDETLAGKLLTTQYLKYTKFANDSNLMNSKASS